ncbi:PH domain-containing protein [Staphylococcus agnetis]|uniref:YokE-like PH domain-containing protein n=1 Tax=Staphylococcus agnetis TaxID=985762 RepID=A0ABX3Z0Y1_9STAP|nr:PH domain-containing protein [Staphylococcus agnetis]MDG4943916.1 PH domain-containing protein [Staphylococcus agnetis]OSP22570.1 hypothetical protein B9L42_00390 [Staphylococcus agnetis]OSP23139.1 hypothetical protein B9M87_09405 [Staphylococcus agnetis]OTW30536.1 hypothetical protein B9M88_09715 [Staphylococcus agnetis]
MRFNTLREQYSDIFLQDEIIEEHLKGRYYIKKDINTTGYLVVTNQRMIFLSIYKDVLIETYDYKSIELVKLHRDLTINYLTFQYGANFYKLICNHDEEKVKNVVAVINNKIKKSNKMDPLTFIKESAIRTFL